MKLSYIISLSLLTALLPFVASAQVTERERPAEWDNLVKGGRYVDRFLPMENGKLSDKVWGARDVVPRFVDNGIELEGTSFWGGNILQDNKGVYHLYVCGWPESSEKGHMAWPNSTVYHATSKKLNGPYHVVDTIGPGHNPEAHLLDDGRVMVYVIGASYLGESYNGPWKKSEIKFDPRDRRIIEGLSNVTFARRPDGSYLAVCRGGGVWISRDGADNYRQITERRIYPPVKGEFEDPVVWRDSLQYHLIVNDWLGRIAFYERSLDGVHWIVEPGEAYVPGISRHKDGKVENWFKYERAKVFQDREGRPVQMNFAVIDTIKWEDHANDNHSSKNICIPLRKDLLLSVLNQKPINAATPAIDVRISAEKGFNPAKDLNIESLRFGSYSEVNFGHGARPKSWRKDGKDLIVTFDGAGSGITEEEFAPKLLGKDRKGEFVIGYARLPYVNYRPAILSARKPVYDAASGSWQVEVENFGLSASALTKMRIVSDGKTLGETTVPALQPYASRTLTIKAPGIPSSTDTKIEVLFLRNGKVIGENHFE